MSEKGRNRREWVKTAAIIFLSILLVLTFFSNTIQNYSLPEVAAQYVESGTITAKIRGGGIIESSDPYEVKVEQTRKVSSVAVKKGDVVQQGDVLVYLEDKESDELKAAQTALEAAQDAYDAFLLSAEVDSGAIANSHSNISTATYRQQINAALAAKEQAEKEVNLWQEKVDRLTADIEVIKTNTADLEDEEKVFKEAKTAKENADFALQEAENRLSGIEAQLEYQNSVSDNEGNLSLIQALENQRNEAKQAVIAAQSVANDAKLAYDKANLALENKKTEEDNTEDVADLNGELSRLNNNLQAAQRNLQEKEKNLTDLTGDISSTLRLEQLYRALTDAQEKVDEETEKSIGAVVTASVAGTITQINATAGKEVSAVEPVAVIQPEGKGFTMSFSVTNEQAKRLAVGDVAELVNSWRYDDVTVVLSGIKPDPTNPGQNKLLTFDVSGSVTAGESLNISVGQKSANYDLIVPNSAIREDNNGKFVLIVESKSSPLGNRYVATRVDVEVLASDDTRSAIRGALEGYEFVITTSTKPVEAGKLVRLSNNNS